MNASAPFRRVATDLPVPQFASIESNLKYLEPRLREQLPAFWEAASGVNVFDGAGNMWLDWTSGVLTANAGHGPDAVRVALQRQIDTGVLHSYRFPIKVKADFLSALANLTGYERAVLLTTGSEAVEVALRIAWEAGAATGRHVIVSFIDAYHGSTATARAAGGDFRWSPVATSSFVQVPFPDKDAKNGADFGGFVDALAAAGVAGETVAGVIFESYQGTTMAVADSTYMGRLQDWCRANGALLIADEIQAGFGRTGKLFGFNHFELSPDIVCCGKGISGSLPLSAVLCRSAAVLGHEASSLNSTHSGNALVLAGALANLQLYEDGALINNAAEVGKLLQQGLQALAQKHPDRVSWARGQAMVGALSIVQDGMASLPQANAIVENAWRQGLLLFRPLTTSGVLIKVAPPLISTAEHIRDGLAVLDHALSG